MSTILERPPTRQAMPAPPRDLGQPGALLAPVVTLVITACLPFTRVYLGLGWAWPVLAAALLAIGIAWTCRRLGVGPGRALAASVVGWLGFVAVAFLGDTFAGGVVPTSHTFRGVVALWGRGTELVRLRPSPAVAEPGLLLLSVTGVWAVAYTVEGMVFRLAAPVQAVIVALVLWLTPLAIAQPDGYAWELAAPFLVAVAWLLYACTRVDLVRWGVGIDVDAGRRALRAARNIPLAIATSAIAAGIVFARLLPGAVDPPWFQLRSLGGATLTSNPLVDVKARLVSPDTRPVLRVRSPRPVYLRITSLDVYNGQREQWTNAGIRGVPVSGPLPNEQPATIFEKITVTVTVSNVGPGAVLVPAPYLPISVSGPPRKRFQYDPRVATLALDRDVVLAPGDQYAITATIPAPPASDGVEAPRGGDGTQLPSGIPPQVGELARQISSSAGAVTPIQQALAIQDELRTWTYSLEPAPGHNASAMVSFLASRKGYCEQFAGTMAVMLRTLGIPARVAVGFTPGTPTGNGQFVVTNANAHAWVEARFPRLGWIAFEPTPRSDGNVLVPSATNLAPGLPQTEPQGGVPNDPPPAGEAREERLSEEGPSADDPPSTTSPSAQPDLPQPRTRHSPEIPLWFLWLAFALLTVGAIASGARSLRVRGASPADRVLRARSRVERLGRGLGIHPLTTETDREYLDRLAKRHPAADQLSRATAAACYAPRVSERDAHAAERGAADLRHYLLDSLPVQRRFAVIVRGEITTALCTATNRITAWLVRVATLIRVGGGR